MSIKVTPLTSGSATPGKEQPGGYYRFQGRQGWPDDPATRDDKGVIEGPKGGAKVRVADRERRSAEYARLRDQGVPEVEAGERIGVQRKTRARYEAAWLASKTGAGT